LDERLPFYAVLEVTDRSRAELIGYTEPYVELHPATEVERYFGMQCPKVFVKHHYRFDLTRFPAAILAALETEGHAKCAWAEVSDALVDDLENPKFREEHAKPDMTTLVKWNLVSSMAYRLGYLLVESQEQKNIIEGSRDAQIDRRTDLTEEEKAALRQAQRPLIVAPTPESVTTFLAARFPEVAAAQTDAELFMLLKAKDADAAVALRVSHG
jgi:hypothetical protein